ADFAIALHNEVIKPGIRLGGQLSAKERPGLVKEFAQLYATQGRLIAEAPQAKYTWEETSADPKEMMLRSYDQAIACDPRAEFYARRGLARTQTPDWLKNLSKLKEDAETARTKARDLPAAHGLLGFVLHVEAALAPDLKTRIENSTLAARSFQSGIDLCRAKGDPEGDLPTLLSNRSDTLIKLAHIEPAKRQEHLRAARKDAQDATTLAHRAPYKAFQALGNALEDSGWLGGETPYYPQAIKAFQRAVDEGGDPVRLRIALGRCQYKSVAYGRGSKDAVLGPAAKVLNAAIDRKPPPADQAEAQYWLGCVYRLQGDYAHAERAFQRV